MKERNSKTKKIGIDDALAHNLPMKNLSKNELQALLSQMEKKSAQDKIDQKIEDINQMYAMIKNNGDVSILCEENPPLDQTFEIMSVKSFKDWFSNQTIEIDGKAQKVAEVWLNSQSRRSYAGFMFEPGSSSTTYYNLFSGYACKAVKGDCSLFLDFVKEVICNNNPEYYDYLIKHVAHAFQKPNELPEVCVILRGGQGIGKSFFVDQFGSLYGNHFLTLNSVSRLTHRFNAHLENKIIIKADEVNLVENKQDEGILKAIITDNNLMIERKGKDGYQTRNRMRFYMTSNEDYVLPIDSDDRRYFILDVNSKYQNNHEYFEKILDQLKNGGKEALLYHLLYEVDLTHFNVRRPPKTEAKVNHKINSLPDVEKFWYECLQRGYQDQLHGTWESAIPKDKFYEIFKQSYNNHPKYNGNWSSEFVKRFKKVCPELDEKYILNSDENKKLAHHVFPKLDRCRKLFEDSLGEKIEWNHIE